MDHMMPKMDGIEATKILRGMGYERPIVALTANAVAGQAEIFLGNGFNDFISKPIDIRQLNIVLNKLIRDKHTPEAIEEARRRAGTKKRQSPDNNAPHSAVSPRFAEIFVRDAKKSLAALEEIIGKGGAYSDNDLRTYVIHVHGMKSALAHVKNMALSALALKLEQSVRNGNFEVIASETPAFLSSLRAFVEELAPKNERIYDEIVDEYKSYLHEKLLVVKRACAAYDEKAADDVLAELRKKEWPQSTEKLFSTIAEHLLHSDFEEIVDVVDKFMDSTC